MKNIVLYSVLALMLLSCEKPPTIEEAKQESQGHLVNGGFTDIIFADDVEPTCDPVFRYRFSFVGKKEGKNVNGCICWTKPTRIFINIYEPATNEQP